MFEELLWFILAVILVTLIVNRFTATKNLPPGPFPLPIIGNAHKISHDSRHLDLTALEKQYGKVFRLYLGSQLVIVVSGGNAVKEVLVTKSAEFAGRLSLYTLEIYLQNGDGIAFADYSPKWRLHRKIVVSALKMYSNGKLKQESIINDEFDLLLKRVASRNGQPHDMTKEIRLAVTNVICTLVFGSRYELDDPEFTKVIEITEGIVKMVASGSVVDALPWLRFFPFKSVQNLKEKCNERDELVENPQDLTDALLKTKKEAEDEDSSIKGFLTDQQLIMTMSEVFLGGSETTAGALCWALLHLIYNPGVQQKLHQELDQVIGPDRLPELRDNEKLPYVKATITETLRISSIGPVAFHKTTVDTTLQGYDIPKGATVLVNLWSLHHDPAIWDEPDDFRPERFLDEDGKFVPPRADRFLPFSAGRRSCLGEHLARIELFLAFSRLLHNFKFENPPGCDLPTLKPITETGTSIIMFEELLWFILAVILVTLIVNRFATTKNLPPGPFPLPIIGNAHKISYDSRHLDLTALEKQYGKVFRLYLGSQLMICVSGGNALKEVLVTKSAEFAGRPSLYTLDVYSQNGDAVAFADYSPKWRLHRKIVVSALKIYSTSRLKQGSIINDEFDLLLKRVASRNGQPHDITKEIRLAVTNVICALVFGSRYELEDPEFTKVIEITEGILKMIASGSVVDALPWLRFFPFKSVQNLKKKCNERDELVGRIYREHVEANRVENPQDLTDALLKAKKEAEDEDSSIKGFLTDQQLIMTMSEVFIGGNETTASALCWALLYLIYNPEVQQKLHQELDQVIGPDRLPELRDNEKLPYVKATITETLRLSSLGPSALHKTTVDTTLQGYDIPKGTTVLVNLWSLHHDPAIWDEPDDFRPERFLDEDGKFVPPRADRFLPFSAGRRSCLGEHLARIELFLAFSRLLYNFKFENPPGCDLPTLKPITGLVLMPQPFSVCAFKRHAR
ncbi:hypothetical protein OS493_036369 [Desmophyllum pertusum]|uniref:Steroid 17-alpha-hydroxylase/17,20 lyase n=1 Tax=Desmophyllum pertusum TaxID=174260 RepID=A0A9W9Y7C4_9CNID|nr:hypothetical protein OS493_036369 [Desmophyllum pertusum]